MKLRFEQPNGKDCGQKTNFGDKLPLPPAWQIEQWKKRKPQVDDRPQPRMEIDESPPPSWNPVNDKKDDVERGVVILEL